MDILLSDEFIAQIEAISKIVLVRQNEDFIVLSRRIAYLLKGLSECQEIDGLKLGLRDHSGDIEGRLREPLEFCISRDLDNTHRLMAFFNSPNAVVISVLGHYDVNKKDFSVSSTLYFPSPQLQRDRISSLSPAEYINLKQKSDTVLKKLLYLSEGFDIESELKTYNETAEQDLCPLVDTFYFRLISEYNDHHKSDSYLMKYSQGETNLLARCVRNEFELSTPLTHILKKVNNCIAIEQKLEILKNLTHSISNIIYYCNHSIKKQGDKKAIYDLISTTITSSLGKELRYITFHDNKDLFNCTDACFIHLLCSELSVYQLKNAYIYKRSISGKNREPLFEAIFNHTINFLDKGLKLFKSSSSQNIIDSITSYYNANKSEINRLIEYEKACNKQSEENKERNRKNKLNYRKDRAQMSDIAKNSDSEKAIDQAAKDTNQDKNTSKSTLNETKHRPQHQLNQKLAELDSQTLRRIDAPSKTVSINSKGSITGNGSDCINNVIEASASDSTKTSEQNKQNTVTKSEQNSASSAAQRKTGNLTETPSRNKSTVRNVSNDVYPEMLNDHIQGKTEALISREDNPKSIRATDLTDENYHRQRTFQPPERNSGRGFSR